MRRAALRLISGVRTRLLAVVSRGVKATHRYGRYEEYVAHQTEKTTDPDRVGRWLGAEWEVKLSGFKQVFERNKEYLAHASTALCLGARTGQEVKALIDIGIDATGIDLIAFHPSR